MLGCLGEALGWEGCWEGMVQVGRVLGCLGEAGECEGEMIREIVGYKHL